MLALQRFFPRLIWSALTAAMVLVVGAGHANASLLWNWTYAGAGIAASGTFTTNEVADATGFYLITGITGTRNGQAITALQPTGTPIPGNEPFAVDNLVRLGGPQLTHNGFGFAIGDGTFSNPFFADFLSPPVYLEFFSAPPFTQPPGPQDSELPINFIATLAVPEPATSTLLLIALAVLFAHARRGAMNRRPSMPRLRVHHQALARPMRN